LLSSLKFASILVLVAALAASGSRAQDPPGTPAPSTVRVNEKANPCVKFRTLPDFESSAIGCLVQGEEGEVIDTQPEWRKLELADGRQGWVAAAYLVPSPPSQDDITATTPDGPEAGARLTELEAALADARGENEALRRRIEEAGALVAEFETRVAELEAERSALSAELETTRTRLAAAEEAASAAVAASRGEESETAIGPLPADPQRAVPVEPLGWEPPAVPPVQPTLERPSEPLLVASEDLIVESDLPEETGADEGAPEPPTPSDTDAAFAEVRNWAQAWADQRVEDYLSHYSAGFQTPGGTSLDDWQVLRRNRILRPVWIEVDLGQPEVVEGEPDRIVLRFTQSYRSDSYGDEVIKRLEMVREDDGWKIIRESIVK
jgi:hypothetical protein